MSGLTEIRRVLRPGGTLGVATWADDPEVEATRVWEADLDAWGAVDPTPMPARRDELMNTSAKLAGLFSAAGLQAVRVWTQPIEHAWDADTLLTLRVTFGRTKRRLESLAPERRAAFLEHIRDRWSRLDREAFLYRAAVVCGVARC